MGFASQLHFLVNALETSFETQFMEDFVSGLEKLVIVTQSLLNGMVYEVFCDSSLLYGS